MKGVIQRVTHASVSVEGKPISSIEHGFLILLGVAKGDTQVQADQLADKISKLRIMADKDKKMNLSITQSKGEILVISQFTLLGNTKKGNRPSFISAALPAEAKKLYLHFVEQLKDRKIPVKTGKFGAYMEVNLINDGPSTILIET